MSGFRTLIQAVTFLLCDISALLWLKVERNPERGPECAVQMSQTGSVPQQAAPAGVQPISFQLSLTPLFSASFLFAVIKSV